MYYRERHIGRIKSNHHHSALPGLENKPTQPATSFSQPHEKVSRQLNCSTAVFCIYYYYYSLKPMAEDSAIKILQKMFHKRTPTCEASSAQTTRCRARPQLRTHFRRTRIQSVHLPVTFFSCFLFMCPTKWGT